MEEFTKPSPNNAGQAHSSEVLSVPVESLTLVLPSLSPIQYNRSLPSLFHRLHLQEI